MVFILWAMIRTLTFSLLLKTSSRAFWTSNSLLASKAEVASSRMRIFGDLMRALASATRWRCPPLKEEFPTQVSSRSGSLSMNSKAFASRAAFSTALTSMTGCSFPSPSASAPSFPGSLDPYPMFSPTGRSKSFGSCST
mmetsp:Transcript_1107/g.3427  ORF Transcript_1107/g.3427 Transcript_1107/m.3427 type:complete len:139 (-) Transcript_1107:1831-2247(-)